MCEILYPTMQCSWFDLPFSPWKWKICFSTFFYIFRFLLIWSDVLTFLLKIRKIFEIRIFENNCYYQIDDWTTHIQHNVVVWPQCSKVLSEMFIKLYLKKKHVQCSIKYCSVSIIYIAILKCINILISFYFYIHSIHFTFSLF